MAILYGVDAFSHYNFDFIHKVCSFLTQFSKIRLYSLSFIFLKPTYFVRILQVVVINLLDGLEVNDSLHLGLVFVCGR